jgi:hypothetical protein
MSADTKLERILVITVDTYSMHGESPNEWGGWKVQSFNRRHSDSVDPENIGLALELGEDGFPIIEDADLKAKFEKGLAFFLTYFEHGNCDWKLNRTGKLPFDFDRTSIAGIVTWESDESDIGATDIEGRAKDAEGFLETYTMWCNGETYEYTIEGFKKCSECGHDKDGEDLESSCALIGSDHVADALNDAVAGLDDEWKDAKIRLKDGYNVLSYSKLDFKDRIIGRKKKA